MKRIILSLLLAVISLSLLTLGACTRSQIKEMVADSAKAYCEELGMDYLGGSSTGTDSDGDGYYSIDARCKDRSEGSVEKLLNLECTISKTGMFATGCKQKVVIGK